MLSRIPVRIRLSLAHSALIAIIFAGIGLGVYRVVEGSVLQSLDSMLLASAKTIRDTKLTQNQKISALRDPLYWETIVDEFFGSQRYVRTYAQLVDTSGKVRARTNNMRVDLPVTPLALSRAEVGMETYESFRISSGGYLRQLTLPLLQHGKFSGELIQVGSSMTSSLSTIKSVKIMLWISLSLGLLISSIFGYLLTWWAFRPVALITRQVARMGFTDNFEKRLALPPADDEVRVLVVTFNELLGRIADAFGRLRRFSGDVSHELRTPISVLRGEAELALRRERGTVEYQACLRTILDEASHMSGIVENLLLLARSQGHALNIQFEKIDLAAFLDELSNLVRKSFEEQGVSLKLTFDHLESIEVEISPLYLGLALKNILLNACKHSLPGQSVECLLSIKSNALEIVVQDHGEGISDESLPYIFDLFYRADTARNRSAGGVGIGLSLAQALVRLHNGRIEVTSQAGIGARFIVVVPLTQTNSVEKALGKRRRDSILTDGPLGSRFLGVPVSKSFSSFVTKMSKLFVRS